MSDEKLPTQIEVINHDAVIELPISGEFYGRITKVFTDYVSKAGELEEYGTALGKFKKDKFFKAETQYEFNVQTLLLLVTSMEAHFLSEEKNFELHDIDVAKLKEELERDVD